MEPSADDGKRFVEVPSGTELRGTFHSGQRSIPLDKREGPGGRGLGGEVPFSIGGFFLRGSWLPRRSQNASKAMLKLKLDFDAILEGSW